MNRWLAVPALCCPLAFAGLVLAFQQATGREPAPQPMASDASDDRAAIARRRGDPLPASAGPQLLRALASEYERPWRELQNSPTRIVSRAGPTPIPTVIVETKTMPSSEGHGDRLLLATVTVRSGRRAEIYPCVVDQVAQEVRLFAGGEWITGAEWLKAASLRAVR